jgi:hypothetical protein
MTDQHRREHDEDKKGSTSQSVEGDSAGDPGRTPGSAEGDRETVEEDLKDKEQQGQL